MKAVVDEPLGDVQLGHAVVTELGHEDELVGIGRREGQVVAVFQSGRQVVGGERRLLRQQFDEHAAGTERSKNLEAR